VIKYEKPKLIKINEIGKTEGMPDCADGYANIDVCKTGGTVAPSCFKGTIPTVGP
jgi:hypothetical protein